MSSWLAEAGADALVLFWWPVALWTVAALVVVAILRFVPERFAREQYELRTALLGALPIGLILAAVFRAISADPLIIVELPYEIVVRANGASAGEIIDLSTVAGVSTGSLLLTAGAAAAALFGLACLVADIAALGRFRSGLREVTDPTALALLSEARAEHGVSTEVRLVASGSIVSPAAFGWLRPQVMVPEDLLSRPDELRLVLLHETAHLARGDFALDTLARVVRTLFGWHPLVTHIFRTHAFWRESACDLAVLTAPHVDRSAYARLLLDVSTSRGNPQPALVASMSATPSQLTKRIEAMNRIKKPDLTLPSVRRALVLSLLAGVVTFTACSDTTPAVVEPSTDDTVLTDAKSDDALTFVDQMPSIIGGINAIAQSIVYPEAAKKERVEGKVLVTFIVETDGSVSNAVVEKGVDARLDAEALRAVESISFEPGLHEGRPARVQMTLPISFKLN
jgi:TonB family protein